MGLLPYSLCICFLLLHILLLCLVFLGVMVGAGGNSSIVFDLRLVSIIFWQKSHFAPLLFSPSLFPFIPSLNGAQHFVVVKLQRKRAGPVRGSALARQLAPTFQVRIGLLPFAQMIYNSWWGCERGVNVSGGRRNVKVCCLLVERCRLSLAGLLQSEERGGWSDLHQMFICACPGDEVTMLIKDLSALMFYSSFMRQAYLNNLSALIRCVYKLVYDVFTIAGPYYQ